MDWFVLMTIGNGDCPWFALLSSSPMEMRGIGGVACAVLAWQLAM